MCLSLYTCVYASSETQGQSVRSPAKTARRNFSTWLPDPGFWPRMTFMLITVITDCKSHFLPFYSEHGARFSSDYFAHLLNIQTIHIAAVWFSSLVMRLSLLVSFYHATTPACHFCYLSWSSELVYKVIKRTRDKNMLQRFGGKVCVGARWPIWPKHIPIFRAWSD